MAQNTKMDPPKPSPCTEMHITQKGPFVELSHIHGMVKELRTSACRWYMSLAHKGDPAIALKSVTDPLRGTPFQTNKNKQMSSYVGKLQQRGVLFSLKFC